MVKALDVVEVVGVVVAVVRGAKEKKGGEEV